MNTKKYTIFTVFVLWML